MKRLLALFVCIAVLVGCSTNQDLSFSEVAVKDLTKEHRRFYEQAREENGVFMFYDTSKDKLVIYFNSAQAGQEGYGEDFTGFDVENDGETLRVSYEKEDGAEESTTDQEEQIYEIQLDKEYETIELIENGEIAAFTSVFS